MPEMPAALLAGDGTSGGSAVFLVALKLVALAIYFGVGMRLESRAYRHLKRPDKDILVPPLHRSDAFHPAGLPLRRRAIRYWLLAGVLVMTFVFFVG
jgi:hypothetical protein